MITLKTLNNSSVSGSSFRLWSLAFLLLIGSSCIGPKLGSYVTMDNSQVIYRGFESQFEFMIDCPDNRNGFVKVEGGDIRLLETKKGVPQIARFKADSISETATIIVYCSCDSDSTIILKKAYPILDMPTPEIYFGGVHLTDYTVFNTDVHIDTTSIIARYIENTVPLSVNFHIIEWSVTYDNKETIIKGKDTSIVQKLLNNMVKDEVIHFNYIYMWFPDGRKVKLYLKRELKKREAGVYTLK